MSSPVDADNAVAVAIGRRPWVGSAGRFIAGILLVLAVASLVVLATRSGEGFGSLASGASTTPAGAAFLLLLGTALWTLTRGGGQWPIFASSAVLVLGIAFLIAQGFGVPVAGQRLSVVASVIIVTSGLALIVVALHVGRDIEQIVLGVAGIVLVSLSVTVAVASTVGVFDLAAEQIAGAAPQIWAAGGLLGGFFLVVVLSNDPLSAEPPRWMPVGVGIATLLMVVILWLALVARERGQLIAQTRLAAETERLALLRELEGASRLLQRAAYWAAGDEVGTTDFLTRFDALVRAAPGIVGGAWFPGDTTPPLSVPESLDRAVVSRLWFGAGADSLRADRVSYAPMGPEQERVAVIIPICGINGCRRGLVGVLDVAVLFARPLADTSGGFHFAIADGKGKVTGPETAIPSTWRQTISLDLGVIGWTVTAWPTASALARLRSNLPATVLFMGLVVAALLPVTLRMGQVARLKTREAVQARLAAALDRATDGVWEFDVVRGTAARSSGLWRYLRYETVPESAGDPWFALIHPDDRPEVDRELERHLAGQSERFEVQYRIRAGDGTWHSIVDRGRVVDRSPTGRPLRMLGISADITEAAAAAAARAESESRFRAVFDSAFHFQILLDLEGRVLEVNHAAVALADAEPRDVVGRPCWGTLWWAGDPRAAARLEQAIAIAQVGDSKGYTEEFIQDGSPLILELCLTPIRDGAGRPTQLLLEGRDDTERRRVEVALQEVSTLTTMGRLAGRVAHEINNPLAGIQNAFLLIKDSIQPDHPHLAYVGMIEREIGRIAAVTRQLYETYRPESESTPRASVGTVVGDAVALLSQLNKRKAVTFAVDVASVPPVVPLPSAMIRQIVFNLLQNAADASPVGGVVTICATVTDGALVIRVRDQGPGVPAELRRRIFEPFFSTKEREVQTGGMGLGLSLVHRSVAAVGGHISVEDGHGGGAEFVVALPVTDIEGRSE